MSHSTYDLIVVGGGPAGYTAAIHAVRKGLRVALVEERELGGTCLNRGCIPTKAYLDTASLLDSYAEAAKRGVDFGDADPKRFSVSMQKVLAYKQRIIKKLSAGIGVLLRENGVPVLKGTASLRLPGGPEEPFTVEVAGTDPGTVTAKKIILACGSCVAPLPVAGDEVPEVAARLLTSDSVLEIDFVPEKLVIIGGGVIGVEMGRIFKSFGAQVHIVEALPRLAPFLDEEIAAHLRKSLTGSGIKVSVGTKVERVDFQPEGPTPLALTLSDESKIEASHVLQAVGRVPDRRLTQPLETLGLKSTGLAGFVAADRAMRTSIPGLFAVGDVNGQCMLAHAAIEMGHVAAEAAVAELTDVPADGKGGAGFLNEKDSDVFPNPVPGCIYGEPEVGYIGLTESVARERFGDAGIAVGRFPFAANGRAVAAGHQDGFVKVVRHREDDRILGVHIIGPAASELINEASLAQNLGCGSGQWLAAVHAHPTYGEALTGALADARGESPHSPPKKS